MSRKVIVPFNQKSFRFETDVLYTLDISGEQEEELTEFFSDLSRDRTYVRLSRKNHIKLSLIIIVLSLFFSLLFLGLAIKTMKQLEIQEKDEVKGIKIDGSLRALKNKRLGEANSVKNGSQIDNHIKTRERAEAFFFIMFILSTTVFIISLLFLIFNQRKCRRIYQALEKAELDLIGDYYKQLKEKFILMSRHKKQKVFRICSCFYCFEFKIEIQMKQIDSENKSDKDYQIQEAIDEENSFGDLEINPVFERRFSSNL